MTRIRWPKTKTPVREVISKSDSPFNSDKCKFSAFDSLLDPSGLASKLRIPTPINKKENESLMNEFMNKTFLN